MGRTEGLASALVVVSHLIPPKIEHEMIPRSKHHAFAYELTSNLINIDQSEPNKEIFFIAIADCIQSMPPNIASELYEKVKLAFIPYSSEHDIFVDIYKQRAIAIRQQQESPLRKLLST